MGYSANGSGKIGCLDRRHIECNVLFGPAQRVDTDLLGLPFALRGWEGNADDTNHKTILLFIRQTG